MSETNLSLGPIFFIVQWNTRKLICIKINSLVIVRETDYNETTNRNLLKNEG